MGSKETPVKKADQLCKSKNSMERSENSKMENKMIDFESGIDTWVINKEDLNGSYYSLNKSESICTSISIKKTTGKENITKVASSTEKNSLRSFRIRKDISYRELSSESENESKKSILPEDEKLCRNKKQQKEFSKVFSCDKKLPNVFIENNSTSLTDLHHATKEKGRLSSGEITLYLSELSSSSESMNEKCREHLHSIENVSSKSESKVVDENTSPVPLKSSCNISRSSSEFNSQEELKPYKKVSNRTSLMSGKNQPSQVQSQKNDLFSFNSGSLKSKPGFLDTYKTHLKNQLMNSENKGKRDPGLFIGSTRNDKSPKKYSLCNQQLFKCSICSYCCSDMLHHKSHLILFHSKKEILDCEYCDYQTSQCANLATHIRIHFQLECPYCDYRCPVKKSLESHLLACHGKKRCYKCNKCNFISRSQIKFKKHSQTHLALGKYKCGDCNLHFTNKKILEAHVKKHLTKDKPFKCFICQLSFCKEQQLKIHLRSHEQIYVCDLCNFKCTYKHKLKIHRQIHTRKSLKCGKCSLLFSRKSNLKVHMRVHFPNSKCKYCPFQSSEPDELLKHICIKNLYNVQKRTLNFENQSKSQGEFEQINIEKKEVKSSLNPSMIQCGKKGKEPLEEAKNIHAPTKPATGRKKHKPNKRRLLSLRSHLPSRVNDKPRTERIEEQLVNKAKRDFKSYKTLKKKNQFSDKINLSYKTRTNLKQSSWVVDQVEVFSAKESSEFKERIKQNYLQNIGINYTKTLFNNKLTPKEILLEPVRLTNGSYIQCYYQSQPSINTPNHLERHIRQSTLLSCRLCSYKTNSSRLLQRHTAKNHTWDPAVVTMLFS